MVRHPPCNWKCPLTQAPPAEPEAPAAPKLLRYQRDAIVKLTNRGGSGGLFMAMGTGKTRTALELAQDLGARRILVVAPLSVVGVWGKEAKRWWPGLTTSALTQSTSDARARAAGRAREFDPVMVVTNYEGYWREPLRSALVKTFEPELVIYDEAHRLKGRATRQSRFAHTLVDKTKWRLALTGTPMANGPEDLFSLYKAVDPAIYGTRWVDFEHAYIMRGGYGGYQIVGYRNRSVLEAKLDESSFRITKEDALDLPPQRDVEVPIILQDRRVYDELKRRAVAEIEGLRGEEGMALSRCVLTNILRLQQVTSGFVKVEDGREIELGTEKYDALADLLSDAVPATGRVVVFCRFRHDVGAAARAAHAVLPGQSLVIHGGVPQHQREAILDRFRAADKAVLVLQVQVGSLGIDLSCAQMAVFYSLDYSLVNYLQARDRLHRLGQTGKVTYYHLVAEHTVDETIYQKLEAKQDLTRSILDRQTAKDIFEN